MSTKLNYFKTQKNRRHQLFAKFTDDKIIFVDDSKIEIEQFADEDRIKEMAWYMEAESFNMIECTKDEFDKAYIAVVAEINKLATI